jgi:hypothetical protein
MITFKQSIRAATIALVAVSLPCSLLAKPMKPIVVRINDTPSGHAVVQVQGAPHGWTVVPDEVDPATVDSGIITLIGVDRGGSINEPDENGWRFKDSQDWTTLPPLYFPPDPTNYRQYATSVDIVWIQHDPVTGDLQVGFDSAKAGLWFRNGGVGNSDADAGTVTNNWVTLWSDDTLILQFKPHTHN